MANRMREEERNEKVIRGLLKLTGNRRCINCNGLGPQYVCTNFWTFICTTCSGIHREFTHRVKSVSMAKFTSQEVSALQAGGNERAKEIYFKEWDLQRHSVPDSSNAERLRDFIKHVYVDRRYTGERSIDRPPRVQGEREDFNENRRADTYRGDSRSPPYEDTNERRYNERPGPGGRSDDRNFRHNYAERRSPAYDQETRRYGDYRRSPGRFEAVDDRLREDRFGNGSLNRRSEEHKSADVASKPEGSSPNHEKDMSSPPIVRPVREILGEDIPPLRVGGPPKANGGKVADGPAPTQRTISSSSVGSADGNAVELKRANSGTLIDFSADPEPPIAAAPTDLFAAQPVQQPTTTPSVDGSNWASFDFAAQEKSPQPPSNANTLESALSQLAPGSATVGNRSPLPIGGVDSFAKTIVGWQWPTMQQHQPSLFIDANSQSMAQQFAPAGGALSNQPWSSSHAPNAQGPFTTQSSQATSKTPQETSAGVLSQPVQPSGRKALPEDLFTAIYSPAPVPVPGWQMGPPRGMGFGVQYPTVVSMPIFPQPPKSSTNPFDLTNEPTLVHASSFPSMASLQGALPNMGAPPPIMRASSFGSPSPQWALSQAPSYPSTMPPSAYMMQQAPRNITPLGHQGVGGFGNKGSAAFGSFSADQQHLGTRYPQPSAPNSFSSPGGNPFG